jgi:ketosteroid isomerase-like protein
MLNGDAGSLADIWSHSATVTTMHPIGGREVGWDKVRKIWDRVAQVAKAGKVRLSGQFIQVAGNVACELGVERDQFRLSGKKVTIADRVTNIHRREADEGKSGKKVIRFSDSGLFAYL